MAIMRALFRDKDVQYTFLSGDPFDSSISSVRAKDFQNESFRWKSVKNIWLLRGRFLWQSGLIGECFFGKYDGIIFLGNPYFLSTWVSVILSRLAGKKVLYWAHAIVRDQLRDRFKLIFFKLAHGLLLYGNGAKQNLVRHGFDPKHIFVIYNSLDYDAQIEVKQQMNSAEFESIRKKIFLHPNLPVLLFVGRLTPQKQLDCLINAGVELHQRKTPVNILFVGDGIERENLEHLVASKKLQGFIAFYGECYDEQKLAVLIAMSDLCVSPGNVGLTAIHALTYGTPVITHDNPFMQMPEYEAIEPGVTGALYAYGSFDSLVNSIEEWLNKNRENREALRSQCSRVIEKYYNPAFQASVIKSAIYLLLGSKNEQ
jgi:glycosyltransferase involved in cell wall biosynthesis